ncbi:MAG: hypothetical protein U0X91_22470 [Spirosomataceae bacterium]
MNYLLSFTFRVLTIGNAVNAGKENGIMNPRISNLIVFYNADFVRCHMPGNLCKCTV